MTEYVPYEERMRRQREMEAMAAADALSARAAAAAEVGELLARLGELLARLGGAGTDCYLEILKPVGWRWRWQGNAGLVELPGRTGGPLFVIDEVLDAYRVPGAIVEPYPEGSTMTFDAFLVPDGRMWKHAGDGVAPRTWQLLASSVQGPDAFDTASLERIAAGLRTRLP